MKKGLSIGLLLVFLFNVGGYHIVFWGLRLQTDQQLSCRVDSNLYDENETIELKIPVALPYPIYQQDFERVDGRFEHDGDHFKMIKHKFENDTLYIVCIRDVETRELLNTMNSYVELSHGLDGASPIQKALNFVSKLVKDFCSHDDIGLQQRDGFIMSLHPTLQIEWFVPPTLNVLAPPPRR